MFTIVISEKGGAERRDTFEVDEITIGRVQGNDIMLAKGNVSKRHARLTYRDGRFIISDLNSTNGTYVNRRRISQATIVREGDRVYVGDYVLRVEVPGTDAAPSLRPGDAVSARSVGVAVSAPATERSGAEGAARPPAPPRGGRHPGQPRLPPTSRDPLAGPAVARPELEARRAARAPSAPPPRAASTPRSSAGATTGREPIGQPAVALIERVSSALADGRERTLADLNSQVEHLIEQQLGQMRRDGLTGSGQSAEHLADAARSALVRLGPLEALLDDDEVTEVTVVRFDHVVAMRAGRYVVSDAPFPSEAALRGAVSTLCLLSGKPIAPTERVVERALCNGTRIWAVVETAAPRGPLLVIRRPRPVRASLDDLIRGSAMSKDMAAFVSQCVAGRINVLVVGDFDAGTNAVTAALGAAASDSRVVVVQDVDDIATAQSNVTVLSVGGAQGASYQLVRTAARVPEARLLVELAEAPMVLATVEAMGAGASGVIGLLRVPDLRRAVSRLVAELGAAKPGLTVGIAREWVASSFELLLEVRQLGDRRYRVTRMAELTQAPDGGLLTEDIFRFQVQHVDGATVDGTFVVAGAAPRILDVLAARGIRVDRGLFSRASAAQSPRWPNQ